MTYIANWLDHIIHPRIMHAYQTYNRNQWLPPEVIAQHQQAKLDRLVEHAYRNVPYYRTRLAGVHQPVSLEELPLLDRTSVMSFTKELQSDLHQLSDMDLRSTGGSTGHVMQLYTDKCLRVFSRAAERMGDYEWTGMPYYSRLAVFWGYTDARDGFKKNAADWIKGLVRRRWKFYPVFANEAQLDLYVRQLRQIRPQMLLGSVSSLKKLADYMVNRGLSGLHPQVVIATAETLADDVKAQLQNVFQTRVYNRYAAGECGLIASECPAGNLHIHADRLIVETVNHGKVVGPGEPGELVITDLDNYAAPLIRYGIGDVGILSASRCPCGRGLPVLEKLLGRTYEYVVTATGEKLLSRFLTLDIQEANTNHQITQLQYVQTHLDRLVVRIVKGPNYSVEFEELIRHLLKKQFVYHCHCQIEIVFEYVDYIEPTLAGKSKMFVSLLNT